MTSAVNPKQQWILKPCDLSEGSAAIAGGKAAMLAVLSRHHIPIPNFFVISAEAYQLFAGQGCTEHAKGLLPDQLADEIERNLSGLNANGKEVTYYAVRSSAVGEDGISFSFAGQFESYLGLQSLSEISQAVSDCWASARSDRLAAYCRSRHIKPPDKLAVIIQQMVEADASGIMFTANPLTGSLDELLIESNFGLGISLAQGAATPDRFHIARSDFGLTVRQLGTKRKLATLNPSGGTQIIEADGNQVSNSSLTDTQAVCLAKLAVNIEAIAGSPQDIEWAIHQNSPFILQSRPITRGH